MEVKKIEIICYSEKNVILIMRTQSAFSTVVRYDGTEIVSPVRDDEHRVAFAEKQLKKHLPALLSAYKLMPKSQCITVSLALDDIE